MLSQSRSLVSEQSTMTASAAPRPTPALVLLVVAVWITSAAGSKLLNFTNSCAYTVWPGITSSGASSAAPEATGFELAAGQWKIVAVPSGWSARVWGRTLCSTDSGGRFSCVTGDCGSGRQDCMGGSAAPPVTLAQFTMDDGSRGMDLYDISLVDGYNLPMLVAPPQGAARCTPAGCVLNLNGECPAELRVMSGTGAAVACKSACQAFGSLHYCCTGEYGNPDKCKPSAYSQLFKKACPLAFSYAYDGADSIFTCGCGGGTCTYTISFCPSTTSEKPSTSTSNCSQPPVAKNTPHIDGGTTPYTGGSQQEGHATAASTPLIIGIVVGVLSVVTGFLAAVNKCLALFNLRGNQSAG